MMKVLSTTNRKAIRNHACDFCGLKINKGESYQSQKIANDGTVYTWKSHLSCLELTGKLDMFDSCGYDEGLTSDDFVEIVKDYLHDNGIEFGSWQEGLTKAKQLLCANKEADND